MAVLKQTVDCTRRMVVYAVFDVLEQMNGDYEQKEIGDIKADISILGNRSEYALAITEQSLDTSILHITMLRPAPGLTEKEKELAVRYLMDSILQHIDDVRASGSSTK